MKISDFVIQESFLKTVAGSVQRHFPERFEEEQGRQIPQRRCPLSALGLTYSAGYTAAVSREGLFPSALMKRAKVIDGKREGSGN